MQVISPKINNINDVNEIFTLMLALKQTTVQTIYHRRSYMGYADKKTLARHNGQPLLNEEGMEAVDALLAAHVGYDEAEALHAKRIRALREQIFALETEERRLCAEVEEAAREQSRARNTHNYDIQKATDVSVKNNNKVYATVLHSVTEDPSGGLWYPDSLVAADETGRSFVEFDQALRATHKSQPAMVIETQLRGDWANLFLARTDPSSGLKPTTITIAEQYAGQRIRKERNALELPVRESSKSVFQINPSIFGRKEFIDDYTRQPSQYHHIEDGFKLVLPHSHTFRQPEVVGEYDLPIGATVEIKGSFGWGKDSKVAVAVGNISVARALLKLQNKFAEKAPDPESQIPLFEQLGQRALGKSLVEIQHCV
jgi:hypothetical protein